MAHTQTPIAPSNPQAAQAMAAETLFNNEASSSQGFTIEVNDAIALGEANKFYAVLKKGENVVEQTESFNTQAAASMAGFMLIDEIKSRKPTPYFFENFTSRAI